MVLFLIILFVHPGLWPLRGKVNDGWRQAKFIRKSYRWSSWIYFRTPSSRKLKLAHVSLETWSSVWSSITVSEQASSYFFIIAASSPTQFYFISTFLTSPYVSVIDSYGSSYNQKGKFAAARENINRVRVAFGISLMFFIFGSLETEIGKCMFFNFDLWQVFRVLP